MLVTPLPYGRMGNRLCLAAHFICHVEKHGGVYVHPAFQPYNRYFEGTRGRLFLRYVSSKGPVVEGAEHVRWRRPLSVWSEVFGLDRGGGDVHMDEERFLELERRSRVLACAAWAFRDREALAECGDAARVFFRPVERWRDAAERVVEEARRGTDALVAVHMRLTDYARFNGGAWFFSREQYGRWMAQTAAALSGKIRFLVFSDAPPTTTAEAGWSAIDWMPGPGHPVADIHAMSLCDAIIGPPSTFSGWASFYGRVPRLELKSAGQIVRVADFSPCLSGPRATPSPERSGESMKSTTA